MNSFNYHKQQGATLIVALVILAIVTIVGVASIRGTNLELKMIATARDRSVAFEAAEAALRDIEDRLIATYQTETIIQFARSIDDQTMPQTCQGTNTNPNEICFTGRIDFLGDIDPNDPTRTCSVFPVDADGNQQALGTPVWQESAFWQDANRHSTLDVSLGTLRDNDPDAQVNKLPVSYAVEFMCFALKDQQFRATTDDKTPGRANLTLAPLFRITAYAEGPGGRARAVTQSMFRVRLAAGGA